jgi:hypothetical protein
MSKSFVNRVLLVLGFSAGILGCSGQRTLSTKQTYPIGGKVTMKGEPVAFAIVHLKAIEGKGADATGYTGADGTFQIRTYSNSDMDGVAVGEYEVEVVPFKPDEFMGPQPKEGEKPTKIPAEARNPSQIVVVDENTPEIDIKLDS